MEKSALSQAKRIILTGFMGSGKSTVGQLLAERLGWDFMDLDSAVEQRCGQTVPEIFAKHGEAHFRTQEAEALQPLLQHSEIVIALGGGAAETPTVRALLEQSAETAIVYLDAPFDVLQQRCSRQAEEPGATSRPLLADRDEALARYHTRMRHYEAISTLRISTVDLSPDAATDAILQQLR